MGGFNQNYIPIRLIQPATSGTANDPLPSTWTLYNNNVTPGDVHFFANTANPFTGVIREPPTGANATSVYYNDQFLGDGSSPHRAAGSLRVDADPEPAANPQGDTGLIITYGTRVLGSGYLSPPLIGIIIRRRFASTDRFIDCSTLLGVDDSTVRIPDPNLAANVWYRVGIEVVGLTVNFYYGSTSGADPVNVSDNDLSLIFTRTIPIKPPATSTFVGLVIAGSSDATDWGGVSDITLESLEIPGGGSKPPGNSIDPFPPFPPTPVEFPPFMFEWGQIGFPYTQLKSLRSLKEIYRNLKIGP